MIGFLLVFLFMVKIIVRRLQMIQNVIILIIGFVILIKGADFVVKGAVGLSKRLNWSQMLVGIVLVGIGTSLPELIVTINSSIIGQSDIILGNAIGSSICNILLVIGIAGMIRPMKIDKRLCKTHLSMSLLTIIVLFLICNYGSGEALRIDRVEAIILLIMTVLYTIFTFFEGKKENEENVGMDVSDSKQMSFLRIFIYIVLGMIGLKYGADFVINEATNIASYFGVSPAIISLTIISIGTGLPEIATSIMASIRNDSDLAVGNVIGSNIYNVCLLPSVGALINPIGYYKSFNMTIIFLMLATVIVLVLANYKNKSTLSRKKAFVLLLLYFIYIVNLF